MIRRARPRVVRRGERYELHLATLERNLLKQLPETLRSTLGGADEHTDVPESLGRLFPPAYPTDESADAAYRASTRRELTTHHLDALATLVRTADQPMLSEAEAQDWLAALNDLRLTLGSTLGVTEDQTVVEESDPQYSEWICYHYLSVLQSELIDALYGALPPPDAGRELPDDPWGDPPGGLRWDGTDVPPSA